MTEEQFATAKEIEKRLESVRKKNEEVKKLIQRVESATGANDKYVPIQISEAWVGSPSAHVHKDAFLETLNEEIKLNNLEIGRLDGWFKLL